MATILHASGSLASGRINQARQSPIPSRHPLVQSRIYTASLNARSRKPTVITRADSRNSDSSFMTGFVLGGVVFGALGFLFAPQISKALLGDDQRLRLPRFMEDEGSKDPEATKQDLIEKIAQLNASIDEVAAKLEKSEKVEVAA